MTSFAVFTLLKATVVCGAALVFSRICRHSRASIHHLIFALAFAALVVVPVASAVLPLVVVTVPVPPQRDAPAVTATSVASTPIELGPERAPFAPAVPSSAPVTLTRVIASDWQAAINANEVLEVGTPNCCSICFAWRCAPAAPNTKLPLVHAHIQTSRGRARSSATP